MTLCAPLYNQLAEENDMIGIDNFIGELNPDMMMMDDDACLDYLDLSEIFSFGDDKYSSEQQEAQEVEDKNILQQNIQPNIGNLQKPYIIQPNLEDDQQIKLELDNPRQLYLLDQQRLHHSLNLPVHNQANMFIKTEPKESFSQKQSHLLQRDLYSNESPYDQDIDLFTFLSPASHYNEEIDSPIDNKLNDPQTENKININNKVNYNIDNRLDSSLGCRMNDVNEDTVNVISRVSNACKQLNILMNPYNWSVDEVNRWICWVIVKISEKQSNPNLLKTEKENENIYKKKVSNSNETTIYNDTLQLNGSTYISSNAIATSTSITTLKNDTDVIENENRDVYSNNTYPSYAFKKVNFNGSYLCNLSQEAANEIFLEAGDALFVELELWKIACFLLENTEYKNDAVYSSFETPLCCDNDQQALFNNLIHPFTSSHRLISPNAFVVSDSYHKQAIRPNTFFTNPQLSSSTDPNLSQPSFFLPPSALDINDYNSPSNIQFFQPCVDMSTNSFSTPPSASPSSIHSDFYDPPYVPHSEPPPVTCVQTTRQGNQLWQFLKELLHQPKLFETCIRWLDRPKGIFKIEDSIRVAKLWGERKNRPAMNYDKLSRSIRQYYKKGIIKKTTQSKRLVYQFCQRYL